MLRLCIATMWLALTACSSDGAGSAPSSGPAGTVSAVDGKVTAQRDSGQARALAVDDQVFGDDTIATADGASVTIALAHNGAAWTLSGGKHKRLDNTAAWRAPTTAQELDVAEARSRTAAAGRHAERSATNRPAFGAEARADDTDEGAATAAPPSPAAATATPPPPMAVPNPTPEVAPKPPPKTTATTRQRPKRGRANSRDKPRGGGPNNDGPLDDIGDGAPDRSDRLSRAQVMQGLQPLRARIQRCADGDDNAPEQVRVAIAISSQGTVASATAKGPGANTPAAACVVRLVKTARFDKAEQTTSVTVPFAL